MLLRPVAFHLPLPSLLRRHLGHGVRLPIDAGSQGLPEQFHHIQDAGVLHLQVRALRDARPGFGVHLGSAFLAQPDIGVSIR